MSEPALEPSPAVTAAPPPAGPADAREEALSQRVAGLDLAALRAEYRAQDDLVIVPDFLSGELLAEAVAEAERLAPRAKRTYVPLVRKGGAISHYDIRAEAPALSALQRSPALLAFFQQLAGPELEHRKSDDPHCSALYVYREKGDGVGWHFDDCGCEPEASFTVILGLTDRSTSRLEFELWRKTQGRAREQRSLATRPGTLAFFCGSKAYHRVTPLGPGEERISFSYVYVKKGLHPQGLDKLWQTGINTFLYFGVGHLFRK